MNRIADDILRGAAEIAEFLGESKRRTFYLLETGKLRAFKQGGVWRARKSALLQQIEEQEARQ